MTWGLFKKFKDSLNEENINLLEHEFKNFIKSDEFNIILKNIQQMIPIVEQNINNDDILQIQNFIDYLGFDSIT